MANSKDVVVGTTPTLLYQADGSNPETVTLDTLSGSDVTLGGPNVVAGHGPIQKTTSPPWVGTLYEDSLYGICATATATVAVMSVLSGGR